MFYQSRPPVNPLDPGPGNDMQIASPEDVNLAIRHQLLVQVDWAKHIPAFSKLDMDDQVVKFQLSSYRKL